MEFINLYQQFQDFFLGEAGMQGSAAGTPEDGFFFSLQKGGYLLEDARLATPNKTREHLSQLVNCVQTFALNLHYFSRVDKAFSDYYYKVLLSNSKLFSTDYRYQPNTSVSDEFNRVKADAIHTYNLFGELASEDGPSTFKPVTFSPEDFANDDQYWQHKEFPNLVISPQDSGSTTNIAFDYTIVKIRFDWYSDPFTHFKQWYVQGKVSGQAKTEGGLFAVPHSLIIIRNLKISGQWNADTMVVPGAVDAYSPFSYPSGPTPITENRKQVVGWIFERLPVLPPNSDPDQRPVSLDLAEKAATGMWSIGQEVPSRPTTFSAIPWSMQIVPGAWGQAGLDMNIQLEDLNFHKALRTWPQPVPGGLIRGMIGPFTIAAGGSFVSQTGIANIPPFVYAPGVLAEIYVVVLKDGAVVSREFLFSGNKYNSGQLTNIRADVSKWAGIGVCFELTVYCKQYALGAMFYWVNPRIEYY
jgi:hypothetical protein